MNNDFQEILQVVSHNLSKINKSFAGANFSLSDTEFQYIMSEGVKFLYEDSALAFEIRKSALNYETAHILGLIENRTNTARDELSKKNDMERLVQKKLGPNLRAAYTHRATLMDDAFQQALSPTHKTTTGKKVP